MASMELPIRTKVAPSPASTNVFRQMELAIRTKPNASTGITPLLPSPDPNLVSSTPDFNASPFDPRDEEYVTLKINFLNDTVAYYDGVSVAVLKEYCPLMYHTIERNRLGELEIDIYAPTAEAFDSFVLFSYAGHYLAPEVDGVALPLIRHLEVCKMARNYDVPSLFNSAYLGFMVGIQNTHQQPDPPIGLSDTIRFIFNYLDKEEELVQAIARYCICHFQIHRLDSNNDFYAATIDLPEFRIALIRMNMAIDSAQGGQEVSHPIVEFLDRLDIYMEENESPMDEWESESD